MSRALLIVLALAACHSAREDVTTWFRVTKTAPWVIAPHALALGGGSTASVWVDGRWRKVAHGSLSTTTFGDGVWLSVHGEHVQRFYRRDRAQPLTVDDRECPSVVLDRARGGFVCVGCGARTPLTGFIRDYRSSLSPDTNEPVCTTLTATRRDFDGQVVWTRTVDASGIHWWDPDVRHFTDEGDPIVETRDERSRELRYLVLGEHGLTPIAAPSQVR